MLVEYMPEIAILDITFLLELLILKKTTIMIFYKNIAIKNITTGLKIFQIIEMNVF